MEPHFQYCCSVWGCCNAAEIQHLQKLLNRAARIVTNSSFDAAIKPMFESLGRKTIQQLINTQSKIVTFKSLAPKCLCELFNGIVHVLPATSATLILMSGCPRITQHRDKKLFPFEVPRYGTASLLRPNWHPHCTNSKNIWVGRFLG